MDKSFFVTNFWIKDAYTGAHKGIDANWLVHQAIHQPTMSTSKSPLVLPIATIQPDLKTVISEVYKGLIPSEPIWVSCYKTMEESVHAKIEVILDKVDRNKVVWGNSGTEVKKDGENVRSSSTGIVFI